MRTDSQNKTEIIQTDRPWMYEYDTGNIYGPASDEDISKWESSSKKYINKGHHGFNLKVFLAPKKLPA